MMEFDVDDSLRISIAQKIKESGLTLDELQKRTGIHRSKLGRIRLAQGASTPAETLCILRALGRPAKADMLLFVLGVHDPRFQEGIAFLDELLEHVPWLIERLSVFGTWLNPRWGRGSVMIIADAIEKQVERLRDADASFTQDLRPRAWEVSASHIRME